MALVPEAIGALGQLEFLLRDPAMQDLLAAAPKSLGRPLRAFCRMLGAEVPKVIAPPARPRPPRPARPPRPKPKPPRAARSDLPLWLRPVPSPQSPRNAWSFTLLRGPPKRG